MAAMLIAREADRLLRQPEVVERTALSRSTIWRKVAAGEFPAPLRVGGRAVRWRASDVQDWIDGLDAQP